VLSQLSRRIFPFFDSFGYTYVIQVSESSLKLALVVSAENVGDVINKVSTLLEKMQIIEPINPFLIISPTNHTGLAEDLLEAYISPLRKTSESRIIKIADNYWVFSSLFLPKEANDEVINYFQDLLKIGNCSLNLSSRIKKKQKKYLETSKNILISYKGSSFEESIEFLNKLQQLSILYKERTSFTLRFHSLNEVKRNKILFLLGLVNKQQKTTNWETYFKIERFIPNIKAVSKKKSRKEAFSSLKEVKPASSTPKNRILQLFRVFKFSRYIRGYESNHHIKRFFHLFRKKNIQESTYKIRAENININSKLKSNKPLVPYGKEVSEKEMEKLVKNIPTPPS
jgi:hypothetical protein